MPLPYRGNMNNFDTIIMTTPADFERVRLHIKRQEELLPGRKIYFVGSSRVGELLEEYLRENPGSERLGFIDENSILSFDLVNDCMAEHMKDILKGQIMPRGVTGWYYQQFLKMQYAFDCRDEYYMSWDGDTVPCMAFNMFSEDGLPFMDLKREYHEEYFLTLKRILPGLGKLIEKSFISEHMLFKCSCMKELTGEIEKNQELSGESFWEKIIHAIPPEMITKSAFSEFETYGSFITAHHPESYRLRSWHSFRVGGDFFDPETICERDYRWLSRDFAAISFEKWSKVREDQKNLFDNPRYQEKLTARQMLEIAQEEFRDGYIEVWD